MPSPKLQGFDRSSMTSLQSIPSIPSIIDFKNSDSVVFQGRLLTIVSPLPASDQYNQKQNAGRNAEPGYDLDCACGFGCIPYASRPRGSVLRSERSCPSCTRKKKTGESERRKVYKSSHQYLLYYPKKAWLSLLCARRKTRAECYLAVTRPCQRAERRMSMRNRRREKADFQCSHDNLLTQTSNSYGISPAGVALYPAALTTSITRSGGTGLPGS